MMNEFERIQAFVNNTRDRVWDVNPSMPIDEKTARSLARIADIWLAEKKYQEMKRLKKYGSV